MRWPLRSLLPSPYHHPPIYCRRIDTIGGNTSHRPSSYINKPISCSTSITSHIRKHNNAVYATLPTFVGRSYSTTASILRTDKLPFNLQTKKRIGDTVRFTSIAESNKRIHPLNASNNPKQDEVYDSHKWQPTGKPTGDSATQLNEITARSTAVGHQFDADSPIENFGADNMDDRAKPSTTTQNATISSDERLMIPPELKDIFGSVVKIYTDFTDPNYAQPWQMRKQYKSTGSGFVIQNRMILTNAHCVAWLNRCLIRKHGSPKKYAAKLIAIAHECDLAVLTVEDEEFWEDITPLQLGDLPNLQDSVVVVGYPTGGDNLCITSGVVSRVDVTTYAHSNFRLLCAQIDAAINPGNSGGPVFKEGKIVGVAFQGYDDAQNIGYVVPTCVIRKFLSDLEINKNYTGFVTLGITYQPLENKSLRKYIGIDKVKDEELPNGITRSGIVVLQTDTLRDEQYKTELEKRKVDTSKINIGLLKNDVILAIDGVDVADDGTIFFREKERVHVSYSIAHKFTGDVAIATVLRNKAVMNVTVPLGSPNFIVPEHQWDKKPRYYIFGGLVFCPLSTEYLKDEFGKKFYERAPSSLLKPLADRLTKLPNEEFVILSQILASDLTVGYDIRNIRLRKVNGIKITNLKHLVATVESLEADNDPFTVFEFDHKLQIILDREESIRLNAEVLQQHAIARDRSI